LFYSNEQSVFEPIVGLPIGLFLTQHYKVSGNIDMKCVENLVI